MLLVCWIHLTQSIAKYFRAPHNLENTALSSVTYILDIFMHDTTTSFQQIKEHRFTFRVSCKYDFIIPDIFISKNDKRIYQEKKLKTLLKAY